MDRSSAARDLSGNEDPRHDMQTGGERRFAWTVESKQAAAAARILAAQAPPAKRPTESEQGSGSDKKKFKAQLPFPLPKRRSLQGLAAGLEAVFCADGPSSPQDQSALPLEQSQCLAKLCSRSTDPEGCIRPPLETKPDDNQRDPPQKFLHAFDLKGAAAAAVGSADVLQRYHVVSTSWPAQPHSFKGMFSCKQDPSPSVLSISSTGRVSLRLHARRAHVSKVPSGFCDVDALDDSDAPEIPAAQKVRLAELCRRPGIGSSTTSAAQSSVTISTSRKRLRAQRQGQAEITGRRKRKRRTCVTQKKEACAEDGRKQHPSMFQIFNRIFEAAQKRVPDSIDHENSKRNKDSNDRFLRAWLKLHPKLTDVARKQLQSIDFTNPANLLQEPAPKSPRSSGEPTSRSPASLGEPASKSPGSLGEPRSKSPGSLDEPASKSPGSLGQSPSKCPRSPASNSSSKHKKLRGVDSETHKDLDAQLTAESSGELAANTSVSLEEAAHQKYFTATVDKLASKPARPSPEAATKPPGAMDKLVSKTPSPSGEAAAKSHNETGESAPKKPQDLESKGPHELQRGTKVRIHGLQDLRLNGKFVNGKVGRCDEWRRDAGRWTVILDGSLTVNLKPENLEVIMERKSSRAATERRSDAEERHAPRPAKAEVDDAATVNDKPEALIGAEARGKEANASHPQQKLLNEETTEGHAQKNNKPEALVGAAEARGKEANASHPQQRLLHEETIERDAQKNNKPEDLVGAEARGKEANQLNLQQKFPREEAVERHAEKAAAPATAGPPAMSTAPVAQALPVVLAPAAPPAVPASASVPAQPASRGQAKEWKIGDEVQFYSRRYSKWIASSVVRIQRIPETGAIELYDLTHKHNVLPHEVYPKDRRASYGQLRSSGQPRPRQLISSLSGVEGLRTPMQRRG